LKVSKSKFDIFPPYDLIIRIETVQEQAVLYNIFNHSFIVQSAGISKETNKIMLALKADQCFSFDEFDTKLSELFNEKGSQ